MTVRCWNIDTMNCTAIIFDFTSSVLSLDFSIDGKHLVSGEENGNVILR